MPEQIFDNSGAVEQDDVRPGDASAPPEQNTALSPELTEQLIKDREDLAKQAEELKAKQESGESGPSGPSGPTGATGA